MSLKAQYSKYYISLNEEDKGLGLLNPPKGSARFEIKDDQCSVKLNIENLKPCKPDYSYKCYLVCPEKENFTAAYIGNLVINNNKGTLISTFLNSNVNNTNLSLNKFKVIAVAYEPADRNLTEKALFPLAGYRNEKIVWKNGFSAYKNNKPQEDIDNKDVTLAPTENEEKNCCMNDLSNSIPATSEVNPVNYYGLEDQWNDFQEPFSFCDDYNETNEVENSDLTSFSAHMVERIKSLENMLSISFSGCKPFRVTKDSIRWWKVKNHQLVKRTLYSSGFPNLILMNNYLHTSHYIYGHYIIGIDNFNGSHYFIYGIPSLYGIDPMPNTLPCTWKSECNNGELYGEFGYWLVKFNMISGSIEY